jgi:hypothetical protein
VDETKTYYSRLAWAAGQHDDEATARGTPPVGAAVSDSDPAHYLGSIPSIDVEKYVWNGTSFEDADTAPGPTIPGTADVLFQFTIYNTGNAPLTGVTLTDTPAIAHFYNDTACTEEATFPIEMIAVGETPVTNEDKWDKIADSYQYESNLTGFDSEFEYAFNVIKQPPIARPIINFGSDDEISSNDIRAKMFRFTHRYKYLIIPILLLEHIQMLHYQ